MSTVSRTAIRVAAALLLLPAPAAFAQRPPAMPEPPRLDQPAISAERAVNLSLTFDPNVRLALEDREFQEGVLQETSGEFDPSVQVSLEQTFERGQLAPGLQRRQAGQRTLFRILSNVLQRVADDLRRNLAENAGARVFIDCATLAAEGGEGVLAQGSEIVIIDPQTGDRTTIRCTTPEERALQEANDAFLAALIAAAKDDEQRQKLEALRARGIELSRAVIQEVIEILDRVAAEQRERLRRLGVTPTIQHRHLTSLFIGYRKPFRTGAVVTPTFGIRRSDEYLIAKRTVKDSFGGRSKPTTYEAALGFQLEVPLLRGRGYIATAGAERAAALGVEASDADFHHTQGVSALRALLDYWQLVAAQKRLALAEESAARYRQLDGMARALVEAEEIARVDLLSVDARIADVRSSVAAARAAVNAARATLARDIGLRVERLDDAPLASDDFPAVATPDELAALRAPAVLEPALARRFDVVAAGRRVESARVILATAREGLRRRLDLSLTMGYLGFEESQDVRTGLTGALFDEWVGPSVLLVLDFDVPFQNNVAIGQFAQASALENQSVVVRTDLTRTISARVVSAIAELRLAADAARNLDQAADLYRRTIDDEYAKYRAGESTIIDVILTEDNLTGTLASQIEARLAYANALARFRFETGTLVRTQDDRASFDAGDARRLP